MELEADAGGVQDPVSALPPEVALGVFSALPSLKDLMQGAALVCRSWHALATHPSLARLWYQRYFRPAPRLPQSSWEDNLQVELRDYWELHRKQESESSIAYSHPTMNRFLWSAGRGHIRIIKTLWKTAERHSRAKAKTNAIHKLYLLGDSVVDLSHGQVKGAAYRSESKRIPLMVACEAGELEVVRFLLEKGAPVDVTNTEMQTPLMAAAWNGHTEIARLLLSKGADPSVTDLSLKTVLISASSQGHNEIVQAIISHADPKGMKKLLESKDQDKRTALWWAACNGHTSTVQLLLSYGAMPRVKDADKRTPEDAALDEGHEDLVDTCFGEMEEITKKRAKRQAKRKRQRTEEEAEYEDEQTEVPEPDAQNDGDALSGLRRSRRLRGEKAPSL